MYICMLVCDMTDGEFRASECDTWSRFFFTSKYQFACVRVCERRNRLFAAKNRIPKQQGNKKLLANAFSFIYLWYDRKNKPFSLFLTSFLESDRDAKIQFEMEWTNDATTTRSSSSSGKKLWLFIKWIGVSKETCHAMPCHAMMYSIFIHSLVCLCIFRQFQMVICRIQVFGQDAGSAQNKCTAFVFHFRMPFHSIRFQAIFTSKYAHISKQSSSYYTIWL